MNILEGTRYVTSVSPSNTQEVHSRTDTGKGLDINVDSGERVRGGHACIYVVCHIKLVSVPRQFNTTERGCLLSSDSSLHHPSLDPKCAFITLAFHPSMVYLHTKCMLNTQDTALPVT